ncbi:uncharacterized protein LOC112047363 isoform X1 [Bicyclus anynana]|uniref:Uncharacterized protein LOC112047363 isoform X1 n=1 Tax=Bicyclus anynana TaxID=110368 RepID=A0A6J1N5D9_BICAN|nr:uncharacterized protein LOC112047363 isoform X1 [Bicyclus anynana]
MSIISNEYINSVINNIAEALELKEWTCNKQSFDKIAQNYFGVIIPIYLSGQRDNKTVNIPIVLKLAPTDERYRVSGAVGIFFAKEVFVYRKVLHRYGEIQKNYPLIQFVMPECYYFRDDHCHELIAMQNMCERGFKPFVSSNFLDINHIVVALESLARFHALSYIFEKTNALLYKEAKEYCVPITEKNNKRFIDILVDRLKKAIVKFDNTKYVTLLKNLEHECVNIIESVNRNVKSLCLCHGDIWKENILFKYEDNLPTSACIIDYQTTRIGSPAFDVLFLIITSTTSCLRKKHFKHLLDVYYETFQLTLKYANMNSEEIYSREMLDYDLGIVGPSCFIVANTAMWLASGLQEEGHVRSKIVLNTDAERTEAVIKYKNIISGIIDDLSDNNYIHSVFL